MESLSVDTSAIPSDRDPQRDRAFRSVGRDDEILVCILTDNAHAAFYLKTACDLIDCLDLAKQLSCIRGVCAVSLRARSIGYVDSWTWTRPHRSKRGAR